MDRIVEHTSQIDDRLAVWRLLGAIAGKSDRAQMLIDRYEAKLRELQAALPSPSGPKPKVALVKSAGGRWFVRGAECLPVDPVQSVGCENAADGSHFVFSQQLDLEGLLQIDPDVILLDADNEDWFPDELYREPRMSDLRAIRDRRVYTILTLWRRSTIRC